MRLLAIIFLIISQKINQTFPSALENKLSLTEAQRMSILLMIACGNVVTGVPAVVPVSGDEKLVGEEEEEEDEDGPIPESGIEDILDGNRTQRGAYLGAPCDFTCSPKLRHVFCNPVSETCECDAKFPVKLNPYIGCGKPKKIGEQCFYQQSCTFLDQYSACIQVHHNAICQCTTGYHSVSIQRPNKPLVFCAEDLVIITSNFNALAGVATGIAVLAGLLCFVLKLFTQNRSNTPHHFANANLAPPILFASDTDVSVGIPLTVHGGAGGKDSNISLLRSYSRASSSNRNYSSHYSRRISGTNGHNGLHKASSAPGVHHAGSRGVLVSASRAGAARTAAILLISCHVPANHEQSIRPLNTYNEAEFNDSQASEHEKDDDTDEKSNEPGSRRPSLASVHSSSSSIRSYGYRRYEKEREEKEQREMQLRLSRARSFNEGMSTAKAPTPSPHSTDELIPSRQVPLAIEEEEGLAFPTSELDELGELGPSTSKDFP